MACGFFQEGTPCPLRIWSRTSDRETAFLSSLFHTAISPERSCSSTCPAKSTRRGLAEGTPDSGARLFLVVLTVPHITHRCNQQVNNSTIWYLSQYHMWRAIAKSRSPARRVRRSGAVAPREVEGANCACEPVGAGQSCPSQHFTTDHPECQRGYHLLHGLPS